MGPSFEARAPEGVYLGEWEAALKHRQDNGRGQLCLPYRSQTRYKESLPLFHPEALP